MNVSKRDEVTKIKEAALSILEMKGRMQDGCFQATTDGLRILYRTPFNRLAATPEDIKYFAATKDRAVNLPYGLDIWGAESKKVLNIEWADDGAFEIVSFKPGPWIDSLVGL